MLAPSALFNFLKERQINFFSGVPDSQLREFLDYLVATVPIGKRHIIAPNEGGAVALAAGYHLATGNIGLVYLQNSGLGNAVNPATSLVDPKVYAIPIFYLIGWRGMPGVHDEPQHVKQGEITLELLDLLGITYLAIDGETTIEQVRQAYDERFASALREGKSVALVAKKGVFEKTTPYVHTVPHPLPRERAIELIVERLGSSDVVVSTTGKISREVYEIREARGEGHGRDFLTVGSMGHASMIALQIAENNPSRRVWCLDGDGAVIMHTGALALIGARKPANLVHIVLNNLVHESVGGLPTVASSIDFPAMARACGYPASTKVGTEMELTEQMDILKKSNQLSFLEVDVANGSRDDLGRPKTTPVENKTDFMDFLKKWA